MNTSHSVLFLEAIQAGNRAEVESLLATDASLVNAQTENGLSAVLLAAYYGESEIARLLAERGASLNIFEAAAVGEVNRVVKLLGGQPELANAYAEDGFQPLGLACYFGHLEVARVLLERGAAVNSASNNNQRVMPLHSAVANQHLELARLLLEHGADVNATQQDDFTPLHEAAQNGQLDMVKLLLEHGANIEAKKGDGKDALAIAVEHGKNEVADYLKGQLVN